MALLLGGTGKSLWRASARSFCCSSFTRGHKLIKRRGFSLKEKVQLHYSEGVTEKVLPAHVWKWGAPLKAIPR